MPSSASALPQEMGSTSTPLTSMPKRASHPKVISIPGSQRITTRRSASNSAASINVFLVRDAPASPMCTLKAAVTRNGRVMGLALKGHKAQVIDLEFLQTSTDTPIQVLGSCDSEGVVFLWFLYVAKDKLGVDVGLRLLKKYSFYSLRRSTTAYYSRIRLAGTIADGTMVIVPNDGSNVRVITFICHPQPAINPADIPALPPAETEERLLLTAPDDEENGVDIHVQPPPGEIIDETMEDDFDLPQDEPPAAKYMPTPTVSGNYSEAVQAEGKKEMEGTVEYEGLPQPYDRFVDTKDDDEDLPIEGHTTTSDSRVVDVQEDIGQAGVEEYEGDIEEEIIDEDDDDDDIEEEEYEINGANPSGLAPESDPQLRHLHTAKEEFEDNPKI